MHDEEIRSGGGSHLENGHARIHRHGNLRDNSGILQLQAIERIRVVVEFRDAEQIILISDDFFELHHASITHLIKAAPYSPHLPLVCDSVAFPA